MKNITLFILISFLSYNLHPQELIPAGGGEIVTSEKPRILTMHGLNMNFLGDASIISVNYDRLYLIKPTFILTGKLGLGITKEITLFGGKGDNYLTIPHHFTGNFGKGRNFLELGIGGTFVGGKSYIDYIVYPLIGYRLLARKSDQVNFRIFTQIPLVFGANYLFEYLWVGNVPFIPFGLSIGKSF